MNAATEEQMFRALYRQQQRQMNAVVRHASVGSPYAGWFKDDTRHSVRRIDALVIKQSGVMWAVEIKVSVSDLRRELMTPEKSETWAQYVNAFYFLVPRELADVAASEIPARFGVLMGGAFGTEVVRRAKTNRTPLPLPVETWRRMAEALGRRQLAEIEAKGVPA